ncbi:hypothetical protein [Planctomicrobium sp. SH527]|uniref:hypothetical protein n=1 Tax=Planctomicrobium sp. SH527 TaxID=3448123 RepID=UPI003F5BD67F
MSHYSTADRWRQNIPATDRPRIRSLIGLFSIIVLTLGLVLGAAVTMAKGAETPVRLTRQSAEPEVVLFTMPGCGPCEQLKRSVYSGELSGFKFVVADQSDPLYSEFQATVEPSQFDLEPGRMGGIGRRPRTPIFPAVWVRGSLNHWVGFQSGMVTQLQQFLVNDAASLGRQWQPESTPAVLPMVPIPDPINPTPSQPAPVASADFEGVHVIVTIANLTSQMPEFRADVARRADRALSELVRQTIGDKVAATIVAEVADPTRFDAVCRAAGVRPGANGIPVACTILIPERFKGLQAMLVKRVEYALDQHFLVPLQSAGISVVIERIHGETYGAVLEAATGAVDGSTPLSPEHAIPFALSAWLAERSNLARRLLAALGLLKE